jgi:type VI secretion system ImpM family protein
VVLQLPKASVGVVVGPYAALYGKLPAHGDFIDRNIAVTNQSAWHDMLISPRLLEDSTSSARCFLLGPGDFGVDWRVGVVIASHDRVGRVFPFAAFIDGLSGWQAIVWGSQISAFCLEIALNAQAQELEADLVLEKLAGKMLILNTSLVTGLQRWVNGADLDQNLDVVGASGLWWWQTYTTHDGADHDAQTGTLVSQWDEIDEFAGLSDE